MLGFARGILGAFLGFQQTLHGQVIGAMVQAHHKVGIKIVIVLAAHHAHGIRFLVGIAVPPQNKLGLIQRPGEAAFELVEFDGQSIRRVYDEDTETWWFSIVDVVHVLTQQADDLTARKYWNQLKRRLDNEGSQLVTDCHQLKMPAADGRLRLTDVATAETLLRLVQSAPSPKAEPIKLWLAKVGYERMQEMADPGLSLDRARQT